MTQKDSVDLPLAPDKVKAVCLRALSQHDWVIEEETPSEIYGSRKNWFSGDLFFSLQIKVLKKTTRVAITLDNGVESIDLGDPFGILSKPMDQLCETIMEFGDREIEEAERSGTPGGSIPSANKLFVSYATEDATFAHRLAGDLQLHGIDVWIDAKGLEVGGEWPDALAEAIVASSGVLLIISPHSMASDWVKKEVSFADKRKKPLLPVIHKQTTWPQWFDLRFGDVQCADFSEGKYRQKVTELAARAKALAVPAPAPRTPR